MLLPGSPSPLGPPPVSNQALHTGLPPTFLPHHEVSTVAPSPQKPFPGSSHPSGPSSQVPPSSHNFMLCPAPCSPPPLTQCAAQVLLICSLFTSVSPLNVKFPEGWEGSACLMPQATHCLPGVRPRVPPERIPGAPTSPWSQPSSRSPGPCTRPWSPQPSWGGGSERQ